jgi:hypothetical protein
MRTVLVAVLIVACVSAVAAQAPAPRPSGVPPNFSVQVWGDAIADFAGRVQQYVELRRRLERRLPPLVLTDNASEILTAEFTLARLVRRARHKATPGDIFTPAIAMAFRAVLAPALNGPILDVILDENPGRFDHDIDSRYPTSRPKATIPTTVLQLLPPLSDDLQYGFIGHQLIIHDTRTNTIVDRMTCAIECTIPIESEDKDDR